MTINLAEHRIARLVDELFSTDERGKPPRYGELFTNPVTGGWFVYGDDPIEPQKETARRALLAREWFAIYGPQDVQPLPISGMEIEDRKYGWDEGKQPEINYIFSRYANSLWANNWDFNSHPSFEDFARGVLASKHPILDQVPRIPPFNFTALHKRYPPRALPGLNPHLYWKPPARTKRAA
jgi:hypothetical protein